MRLPRWLVMLLLGSSVIVVLTAACWWWLWWPERTVRQFELLWNQNGRQEAARLLMAPPLFEVFSLREQIRHEQVKLGEKVDEKGLLIDPILNLVISPRTCRDVMSGRATAYRNEMKDWYVTVQRGEVVDAGWTASGVTVLMGQILDPGFTMPDGAPLSIHTKSDDYRQVLDEYKAFSSHVHTLSQ
jgi:hypothetical protein